MVCDLPSAQLLHFLIEPLGWFVGRKMKNIENVKKRRRQSASRKRGSARLATGPTPAARMGLTRTP
jgi:hypothetical protein